VRRKIYDLKDSFYEKLEHVFSHFLEVPYEISVILLGDFNAKRGVEVVLKSTIWNVNLLQSSNNNGVRIVNFGTSYNLIIKSTMFPHLNTHKYTWTSSDDKTHNQIDHILIDRR
jgi:hypothetical protein